ncbi:MAG: sigma-70 family RNA polymerase sigma factor [Rhodospirillales bacterium]|nr:sigma-70 family RNA polymerase sigma factor [Rhodospirillales bacterium]
MARAFLFDTAQQPFLDRDEERSLALGNLAGDARAAHRLIASHLRMVVVVARRYRSSGVPMSDLVQEGIVGLIQAVRRFDPDYGVRLSTYALWSIRAAMQDYVVRSWSLVRIGTTTTQKALFLRLRQMAAELRDGAEGLSDDLVGKLAARLGTTATEVRSVARRLAGRDQSLDQTRGGSAEGQALVDTIACPNPTPEDAVVAARQSSFLSGALSRAIAALSPREQTIIRRRYFEEVRETFEAIGRDIGVSKDRVRQLEIRALAKLRGLLAPVVGDAS